jgi:light-harvesting complex II chlorophyll a/b binding protein 4
VPYSEVFGLQRFRESELIHGVHPGLVSQLLPLTLSSPTGRWAMLASLGALVAEQTTGVSWVDAGKVELDGASYAGLPLPFSITQLIVSL